MICPDCRSEYDEGIQRCADCAVDLVEQLGPPPKTEWRESFVALETSDPALLLVAESVLRSASIPFLVIDDRSQDLIGLGRMAFGFNPATGPARIEVPREFAGEAQRLLEPVIGEGPT